MLLIKILLREHRARSDYAWSGRLQAVKNDRKLLNRRSRKVVAVAYRRLKTMENSKAVVIKSGRPRLQEVVVYERFQM